MDDAVGMYVLAGVLVALILGTVYFGIRKLGNKKVKKQNGRKISFNKSALANFSDGEIQTLYVFSHVLNRLKLLEGQVYSHWATAKAHDCSEAEKNAALLGVFESLLLLAGELKESWGAVQKCYHKTALSKAMNPLLPPEIQKQLKLVSQRFSSDGIIHRLRNDFAFHHSPDQVLITSKLLDDDDIHLAYLFEGDNNYFDYATRMLIGSVAEAFGLSDWNQTVEYLIKEIVGEVYNPMSSILNAVLIQLFMKISLNGEEPVVLNIPHVEELRGRYFFCVDPPS